MDRTRRVLSVGQCGFDHGMLARRLKQAFGAEVVEADTAGEAIGLLRTGEAFDLVLVNRIGALDGAPGSDLIRALKADPATAGLPVMLVSNLDDAQARAVELGALPGFGKAQWGERETLERLGRVLGPGH